MAPIALIAANSSGRFAQTLYDYSGRKCFNRIFDPCWNDNKRHGLDPLAGIPFMDYVRVGGPLLLLFFITTVLVVPLVWNF